MAFFHYEISNISLYILCSLVLAFICIIALRVVSPDNVSFKKLSAKECGFNCSRNARNNFDVFFFLVSLSFLFFDLETVFFLSWGDSMRFLALLDEIYLPVGILLLIFFTIVIANIFFFSLVKLNNQIFVEFLFSLFHRFSKIFSFFIRKYKNMNLFILSTFVQRPILISLIFFFFSLIYIEFIRLAFDNNVLIFIPQGILFITLCGITFYYFSSFSKLIIIFMLTLGKTKVYCSKEVSDNSSSAAEAVNLPNNLLPGGAVQGDGVNLINNLIPGVAVEALDSGLATDAATNGIFLSDKSAGTSLLYSDLTSKYDPFFTSGSAGTSLLYGGLTSKYDLFLPVPQQNLQVFMLRHRHLGGPVYNLGIEDNVVPGPNLDGVILPDFNGQQVADAIPALFRAIMAPVVNNEEGVVFTPAGIRHLLNYLRNVQAEFLRLPLGRNVDEPYRDFFLRYLQIVGERIQQFEVNRETILEVFFDVVKLIKSLEAIFRRNVYAFRNEILNPQILEEFWNERLLYIGRLMENIDLVIVNPPVILFNDVLTLLLRFITRSDFLIIQNLGQHLTTHPVLLLIGFLMAMQSLLTPQTFVRALPIFVFNLDQVFVGLREALQPIGLNYRNFASLGNIVGQGFQQGLFIGIGIFTVLVIGRNIPFPNININLLIDNRHWFITINPTPTEPGGETVISWAFKFIIKTVKKIVRIRIIRR